MLCTQCAGAHNYILILYGAVTRPSASCVWVWLRQTKRGCGRNQQEKRGEVLRAGEKSVGPASSPSILGLEKA